MNALIRPHDISPSAMPLTAAAVQCLADSGVMGDGFRRVQLIDGVLKMAPPPGGEHRSCESLFMRAVSRALITNRLDDTWLLLAAPGLELNDQTILVPDFLIVPLARLKETIRPVDILVAVEVAWTSRAYDLGDKAALYAAAGIVEYWVLDIAARSVVVHRSPEAGRYKSIQTLDGAQVLTCQLEPAIQLSVSDLF